MIIRQMALILVVGLFNCVGLAGPIIAAVQDKGQITGHIMDAEKLARNQHKAVGPKHSAANLVRRAKRRESESAQYRSRLKKIEQAMMNTENQV